MTTENMINVSSYKKDRPQTVFYFWIAIFFQEGTVLGF